MLLNNHPALWLLLRCDITAHKVDATAHVYPFDPATADLKKGESLFTKIEKTRSEKPMFSTNLIVTKVQKDMPFNRRACRAVELSSP